MQVVRFMIRFPDESCQYETVKVPDTVSEPQVASLWVLWRQSKDPEGRAVESDWVIIRR